MPALSVIGPLTDSCLGVPLGADSSPSPHPRVAADAAHGDFLYAAREDVGNKSESISVLFQSVG